jgi:hypothetical protein
LTTLALLEYGPQDLTDLFAGQIQLTELGFDQFLTRWTRMARHPG